MLAIVVVLAVLAVVALSVALFYLLRARRLRGVEARLRHAQARLDTVHDVETRYRDVIDLEAATAQLHRVKREAEHVAGVAQEQFVELRKRMQAEISGLKRELDVLHGEAYFAEFGFYHPQYAFESSAL